MSYARPGIKALGICTKATLSSTKTNQFILGLRDNVSLEIKPFNTPTDHRNRDLKNMMNFKIEGSSHQGLTSLSVSVASSISLLSLLVEHAILNGVDAELVGEHSVWNATEWDGDVYQLAGDYFAGIDFDFELTEKTRKTKLILEAAFNADLAQTNIITPSEVSGTGSKLFNATPIVKGLSQAAVAVPTFYSIKLPHDTAYNEFLPELLTSLSFKMKNSGEKSIYNRTLTEYFEFDISFTVKCVSNAQASDTLKWITAKSLLESFKISQFISASITDVFMFNTNALSSSPVVLISDDKREVKVSLKGKVPYADLAFNTTTGYTELVDTLSAITAGTISLTIDGVAYTEAFDTSVNQTVENFVVTHQSDLNDAGIILTSPSAGALKFVAAVAGESFTFVETSAGTDGVWTKSAQKTANILTVSA